MRFTKMHGLGNDYIYINAFEETVSDPSGLSVVMSRPHTGVGSDGLILLLPSRAADLRMRMFNSDGSEAEMCGNGARCVARYAYDRGLVKKPRFRLETKGGIRDVELLLRDGTVEGVRIDMGIPQLAPARIPVLLDGDRIVDRPFALGGRSWPMTCVSMGNPHAVLFVEEDPFALPDFEALGPALERHPLFPERTNVEFVQRLSDAALRMRVWERGSGETLACGTGACAAAAAGILTGRCGKRVTVTLRGGDLTVDWPGEGHPLFMTGPAAYVFEGVWLGDRSGI